MTISVLTHMDWSNLRRVLNRRLLYTFPILPCLQIPWGFPFDWRCCVLPRFACFWCMRGLGKYIVLYRPPVRAIKLCSCLGLRSQHLIYFTRSFETGQMLSSCVCFAFKDNRKAPRGLSDEIWRSGCLFADPGSRIPEPWYQPWNPKPKKNVAEKPKKPKNRGKNSKNHCFYSNLVFFAMIFFLFLQRKTPKTVVKTAKTIVFTAD